MDKELLNGNIMPPIGFGTWRLGDGVKTTDAVLLALQNGYRKLDCAYSYGNDFFVGKAIKKSEIAREDLFITNKVWNDFKTKEEVVDCCRKSLKLMKLDYFDLYLIHWPTDKSNPNWKEINVERWLGMEELYNQGLVKSIGVSNFKVEELNSLMCDIRVSIMPMVNQIECHPGYFQDEIVTFCEQKNMIVEAYSPLGSGNVFSNQTLMDLSKKYNKSIAQLCLRWEIQKGVVPIPRAENEKLIKENIDVFDFNIEDEDIEKIDNINNINGNLFSIE